MRVLSVTDSLLDSVSRCFTEETVRALAELRTDEALQRRVEELADKANEGELTEDERAEYMNYIEVSDIIMVLQLKARLRLRELAAA